VVIRISACIAGMAAMVVWLVTAVRFVDGVDLHVFVCEARDLLKFESAAPDSAYRYFPGVYTFWRFVLLSFGDDYSVLQRSVISLLAANTAVVALLTFRLTAGCFTAIFAAALYVCLVSRFEGLSGTAEPLGTFFFLSAVLAWSLCGQKRRTAFVVLGIGLGLTVYCKQQAGLLSLGTVWFLIDEAIIPDADRLRRLRTVLIGLCTAAICAAGVLFALVLLEGQGLIPLLTGLKMVTVYKETGGLAANLYSVLRNDESVGLMGAVLGVATVWRLTRQSTSDTVAVDLRSSDSNDNALHRPSVRAVVGLLITAAVASLIQFRTRGYYHYFLLAIPSLVVSYAVVLRSAWLMAKPRGTRTLLLKVGIVLLGAVPFLHAGDRSLDFELWDPVVRATEQADHRPWHRQPEVARDLAQLREQLPAGGEMLVLPPVRAVIYLQTDGHQPAGYAFGQGAAAQAVDTNEKAAVVVLRNPDGRERANWEDADCDSAMLALQQQNFRSVWNGRRMELLLPPQGVVEAGDESD
jgi:hypothetical protein